MSGFFNFPQSNFTNKGCETGPTVYRTSLSERTRKSNHLQMSLQRQHFLLRYLKTLGVGPVGVYSRKAGGDLYLSKKKLETFSRARTGMNESGSFVQVWMKSRAFCIEYSSSAPTAPGNFSTKL